MTVQGNNDAGTDQFNNNTTYFGSTYTLTLYSINATTGVATNLASSAYTFADQTGTTNYKTSYLTFTLPTPLALTPGTQYAYTVSANGGYYGFAGSGAGGVVTTGGQAVGITAGGVVTNDGYSRNFDVGLTNVPEPGAWLRLSIAGLALFLRFGKRQFGSLLAKI